MTSCTARTVIDARRYDAVLFDLDGVVTDTAAVHAQAWRTMFDRFFAERAAAPGEDHRPFGAEDYRRFVDGKPRTAGIVDFLAARGITLPPGRDGDRGHGTVSGLADHKQRLYLAALERGVPVVEPTVALLRRLRAAGVATALYTSSRNGRAVLAAAGLTELFTVVFDGRDAGELRLPGKPDPAVLVETARRCGVRPDRCVVVDDSAVGVYAARQGGFGMIVGLDRTGAADQLWCGGADVVTADLTLATVAHTGEPISGLPRADDMAATIEALFTGRRPALILDFDTAPPGITETLGRLAALCPVAVVSGRDLDDLGGRLPGPGLWYAGDHGFELMDPAGRRVRYQPAAQAIPALASAAGELDTALGTSAGITLQHRRYAVAVHYCGADREAATAAMTAAHQAARRHGLRIGHGREFVELRPALDWDTGDAVRFITDQLADDTVAPIYLGGGLTGEDAMDAVRHNGIGVVVRDDTDGDRRTAARWALSGPAAAARFLSGLADLLTTPVTDTGEWWLTFDGYDPAQERLREVLCTVGNGYLGVRGCAPESHAGAAHYPGSYVAGLYNRLTDHLGGRTVDHESIVNLPNWVPMTFRAAGGAWFDIDTTEVLSYRQRMNLRDAELVRELRVRDHAGHVTTICQRRIASMASAHLCALQVTLTAENWSGPVELRSGIDAGITNAGVQRYRQLAGRHLGPARFESFAPDTVVCRTRTVQSEVSVAVATRTTVWDGDLPAAADYRYQRRGGFAGHHIAVRLSTGRPLTVDKVAAVFTGRDHAVSEPAEAAARAVTRAGRYPDIRRPHATAWSQLWESFRIHLDGRATSSPIINLHTLHLLQSVSRHCADLDVGVPARGLHGEAYRGHIFWDEMFIEPVLTVRLPQLVKSLLEYRHRRLPEARRAATDAGYRGAMFPWQSGSDGREESPRTHLNPESGRWNPDPSARAAHAGIAVAYTVWQYYQATSDLAYLAGRGAETLAEIARFWSSRAGFDEQRGRYVINGVIGPDEFHTGYTDRPFDGIDNNAYTNIMAVWVIRRALDALDALPLAQRLDLVDRVDLRGDEIAHWRDVAHRMYVPFHDGVISQFDGYEQLRELDWDGYRRRYGNIGRLDRILEAENDSVNNYRAAKQADVLMLFYLLSADELRDLLADLGYAFAPQQIPRTVDYYLSRTSHGSTLSAVVHSWVLARGNRQQAMSFFQQVLDSDVTDAQGGTTEEGIHLAAMAGSIDLLQRCYTGLELREDRLVLGPLWPESAGVLRFSINYRQHRLHLRIRGRGAEVTAEPGAAGPITLECRGRLHTLAAGERIHVS